MVIIADHEYHMVELEYSAQEVLEWCFENFGQARAQKWFNRGSKIYFYDHRDHMMFLLRWA